MYISEAAFKLWTQGDLSSIEKLFTEDVLRPSNPFHCARALAHRALVRARLKQHDMAIDDAKKVNFHHLRFHAVLTTARQSIEVQRSAIGYIAHAVAHIGNGEHESAMRIFDLVFSECTPSENRILLLIKVCAHHPRCCLISIFCSTQAIILFECRRYEDAILRVDDLIDIVDNQSPYIAVRVRTR